MKRVPIDLKFYDGKETRFGVAFGYIEKDNFGLVHFSELRKIEGFDPYPDWTLYHLPTNLTVVGYGFPTLKAGKEFARRISKLPIEWHSDDKYLCKGWPFELFHQVGVGTMTVEEMTAQMMEEKMKAEIES